MGRARYADVVTDPDGRPVAGTAVDVFTTGTTTPVAGPIYAAPTGAATLANPFTVGTTGELEFYLAAPVRVDLRYTKTGYTSETHTVDVLDADHAHSIYAPVAHNHSGASVRAFVAAAVVVNNTTTYSTVLSLPIEAGKKYVVGGAVSVDGSQAADMKLRLQATNSTGATGWFGISPGPANSNTSTSAASMNPANAQAIAASAGLGCTAGLLGVGTRQMLALSGYVQGGSVAGTLDVQCGQNTADATDTTFHVGSWLELAEVV